MKYTKIPLVIFKLIVIVINILFGSIEVYKYYFTNPLFYSKNEIWIALNYFIISIFLILFVLLTEEFKKTITADLVGVSLLAAIGFVKENPYSYFQILGDFIVSNQSHSMISIIVFILKSFSSLFLIGLLIYQILHTLLRLSQKIFPNSVEDKLFNRSNKLVLIAVVVVALINIVLGGFDIHYHYTKSIMVDSPNTSGSVIANAHFFYNTFTNYLYFHKNTWKRNNSKFGLHSFISLNN